MKQKINYLLFLFLFNAIYLNAQQVPGRINYQTVIRDISSGNPLATTTVALRFTVVQDDANTGAQIYKEQHFGKTTNQYGLITLQIGSGEPVFGNFNQIDWTIGIKFIRVEVDISGTGNNWQLYGTNQLVTVPYAFVAQSAFTLAPLGAQTGQVLKWTGTAWAPGNDLTAGALSAGPGIDITGTTISLASQNAATGQVLKWNGTSWVPGTDVSGSDNWGTQVAQTTSSLNGNGTISAPLTIAQQNAVNGQVLKWNGTTWTPGNDVGPDNWGTQVTQTTASLSGNGTISAPLTIAQQNATNGQVLKWNGTAWIPGDVNGVGDNWGAQVTQTAPSLSGNGTVSNPLTLAQQSAATGQVLKWSGAAWLPGADNNTAADNWGTQVAQTAPSLSGNGTVSSPLTLAQQSATTGQVLKWNGTAWIPGDVAGIADNWGTQVTQTTASLSGNGTAALPLTLAQQSATTGQVLKWSGTAWVPGTDNGLDNWGTQVTQTTASLSGNGTATLPLTLAQQSATTGQVLKWSGTAWIPGTDNGSDNWGTQVVQTNSSLSGNGTAALPLTLAQQSASTGQVLKWSGTAWIPGTDNNTGPDNWGTQTVVTGTSIAGVGTVGNPLILAQQSAINGQVLKWNGSAWVPGTDNAGTGTSQWQNNGTKIYYNTNNVGIGIADPLYKLHVVTGAVGGNAIVGDGTTGSNIGVGVTGLSFGGSLPPGFDIGVYGSGTTGLYGSGSIGAYGKGNNGVQGISTTGELGVYGETNGGSGFGNAVYGLGLGTNDNGVWGKADAVNGFGVYGESTTGYGVVGSSNSSSNYGVWGMNSTSTGFAGFFTGKVQVTGMLSKGGGTFKIDHPLDPQNKYLYHSFVESPDMMNIYNGNVVTNQQGLATITLPEYFEALNKDFRYQLTCIGTFAQVIVEEKIKNNQFVIRTDKPNVEVSWLVTGVRKDRFAEANRVIPEVEKTGDEKGRYLHPELFGQPAASGIGAAKIKPATRAPITQSVKSPIKE